MKKIIHIIIHKILNPYLFYLVLMGLLISGAGLSLYAYSYLQNKQYPLYTLSDLSDPKTKALIQAQILPDWLPKDAQEITVQHCHDYPLCLWVKFHSTQDTKLLADLGFTVQNKPYNIPKRKRNLPQSIQMNFPSFQTLDTLSGQLFKGDILFDDMRGYLFIHNLPNTHQKVFYYWIE